MALALFADQGAHRLRLLIGEQARCGQRLRAHAAEFMPPTIDDGVAVRTTALRLGPHTACEKSCVVQINLADFQFPNMTSYRAHAPTDTTDFRNVALHFGNRFIMRVR